jgi:hypothetical protein
MWIYNAKLIKRNSGSIFQINEKFLQRIFDIIRNERIIKHKANKNNKSNSI